ncbi:MAG: hypothetical protein WC788_04240 [Candidatus Paceibacterota bacterium]|jgi:hypothetical protein
MKYGKALSGLAIILAFLTGLALGYTLKPGPLSGTKTINLQNDVPSEKNDNKLIERETVQADLTAKEALRLADQDALAWSEDSYLSEITLFSKKFTAEGKSNGWKFVFYSQAKNMLYEIVVKDGESRGGEEKESVKALQTLKGEFVDSTLVAKTFFSTYPENPEITSLSMHYDAGAKKFIWTIFFPKGSHTVNAEI